MKLFFCTIAAVSAVVLFGKPLVVRSTPFQLPSHLHTLLSAAAVQKPIDGTSQQHDQRVDSKPAQQNRHTQWLSQNGSNPDLSLLAKVITGFLKSDAYQTQSALNVNAVVGNTTVTSEAQIQTTAQFPNKFRTEIAFAKPGTQTQIKTLVIADGTRVWVYRADLKQYAVFSFKDFDQLADSYWIGFATTMFAQVPPEAKTAVANGALSDTDLMQKIGLELSALKGGPRTADNQNFYAYEYKDTKQGFLLSAFVEPASATLKQLRITGKFEDSDITMVERILSRVAIAPVSASTFTFTPPNGAKKVKAFALGPL